MRVTNNLGLPQPIVDAVSNDDYTRGNANISATSLLLPPRLLALREAHDAELEEDASDRIFSLFGKAIHKILEDAPSANQGAVSEQRLYMQVQGPLGPWVVSGAMDRIVLLADEDGSVTIQDYKTASVAEMVYGVKPERAQQLNIYAVLATLNGYKVKALQDVFILRDWSKVQAAEARSGPTLRSDGQATSSYPEKHVVVHDIELWPMEDAYRFIAERVALHQQAQAGYIQTMSAIMADPVAFVSGSSPQDALPECTDEERWIRGNGFAVMKPGNKVATKVLPTREAAEQFIVEARQKATDDEAQWRADHPRSKKTFEAPEYTVEERKDKATRCLYYCPVSAICDQWKAEQP